MNIKIVFYGALFPNATIMNDSSFTITLDDSGGCIGEYGDFSSTHVGYGFSIRNYEESRLLEFSNTNYIKMCYSNFRK